MAYPVPLLYNDDRNARRDYDYMKSIYPDTAKRVLPYMEEECDRMEYDGSMMYDEYPDRLQLRLMCRRIYDKAEKEEENPGAWLMDLRIPFRSAGQHNLRREYRSAQSDKGLRPARHQNRCGLRNTLLLLSEILGNRKRYACSNNRRSFPDSLRNDFGGRRAQCG